MMQVVRVTVAGDVLKDTLYYILFCLVLILIGSLLYLLGNWIFGKPARGGKRFVLFSSGIAMGLLAVGSIQFAAQSDTAPGVKVIAFCFGVGFGIFAVSSVLCSVLASNQRVEKWFEAIFNGL